MELFKIIGIGLITSITALILKQIKPEMAMLVVIAGCLLIFFMLVSMLSEVIDVFNQLVYKTGIDTQLFGTLLKIVGIAYITEFSANICLDSGNSSVADKVLLSGKIVILIMSLPIITNLIDIIVGMLPWKKFC